MKKLTNTYYRSLTPDGIVWCESRNPNEVKRTSEGRDCTFERYDVYEVSDGWTPWKQENRHILYCAACAADWEVSAEDPDGTLTDALEHAARRHPGADPIMTIKERNRPAP